MMSSTKVQTIGPAERQTSADIERLAQELYCERVLAARRMPPEEKLLAGEELFEYACAVTLAGIRNQFPEACEVDCRKILAERLALRERMERQPAR